MAASIRLATRSDAAAWLDLLRATIGPDYPAREVYTPEWIATELSPFMERQTWVADSDGRLMGSISFLKPIDNNLNPVANLGRCLFRPEAFSGGAADGLLAKVQAVGVTRDQMIVARVPVPDRAQQGMFERIGFSCVGFQPFKHSMPRQQGILFYIYSAKSVLGHRLPFSESLPQVCELGSHVLKTLQLPPLVTVSDGATGYPLQTELRVDEVNYEDFSVWRNQAAGRRRPEEISAAYHLGLGMLRVAPVSPPFALLAQNGSGPTSGLAFVEDPHDRCIRICEAFTTDDLSMGALMRHAVRLAQEKCHASYVEMDVLANATRLLKTAEQLGFVPVAYMPAFVSQKSSYLDVVKMVKLNVAYAVEEGERAPGAADIIEISSRCFDGQKLGVAVINMLRTLPMLDGLGDGELRKVARLFEQKLRRPGEIIFREGEASTEAYVVMRGQVEITVSQATNPIATVGSGQVFGEQAFLDGSQRGANAVAAQPSILLVIQRDAFSELTQREPHLGMVIMRNLALELSRKLRRTSAFLASVRK